MSKPRRIPADVIAFLCLFAVFFVTRGGAAHVATNIGIDGGYYMGVAEQVRRGAGLSSNLSIYNFGYSEFPSPTGIYPLWPLLLGTVGRFVDMEAAAHWLPWALYMLSGLPMFLLGRAAFPAPLWSRISWFHAGHLLLLLLWTNPQYRAWSLSPYTEPLAWSLLLSGLWRLVQNARRTDVAWALELGVWAMLPFFARAQLLVFPLAIVVALALQVAVGPKRGTALRFGAAVLSPMALAVGAWWAWVASFSVNDGPGILLRFDRCRVSDLLPELVVMVQIDGFLHYVGDRLFGLVVAWSFTKSSYWDVFYVLHWVVPLALVPAVGLLLKHRWGLIDRCLALLRAPDGFLWSVLFFLAWGAWLSVQLVHKQFSSPWYFDQREGLVSLFAFAFTALWLIRRGGFIGLLAAFLVFVSLGFGVRGVWRETRFNRSGTALDQHGRLAVGLRKLDAAREGQLIVVLEEGHAQRTAWRTPEIGYHWLSTRTTYATVAVMTGPLGADAVIWHNPRESWGFLRNGGHLEADYARLTGLPSPFKGVEPRSVPVERAPPRRVVLVAMDGLGTARMPGGYARFELGSTGSAAWRQVSAGSAGAGFTVWEWAAQAQKRVGLFGWPGATEHEAGVADIVAAWAAAPPDLSVVRLQPGDIAGLSQLADRAGDDAVLVVVVIDTRGGVSGVWFRGADIAGGKRPRTVEPADVAPTVAWLLGVPVAGDLSGRVLSEALSWDAAGAIGRQDVERWE
ncbi:MAG: hypothetical protein EXR71_19550 [Myxococcales bacterium]|nr:hypothetical protein [Myxococcales bacterium]